MSDIQNPSSIGYLTYAGDYSVRNTETLSGVTQLWQDAFARAMAQQVDDNAGVVVAASPVAATDSTTGEPIAGARTLHTIVEQRTCPVEDHEINPPEPLFLPIAEFEWDLAKPPVPFSASEMIEQQRHLEIETHWVRPAVLNPYDDSVDPGPGPQPRPLFLPIAEFEWDLADKPATPYSADEMTEQQRHLDFDNGWARPIVLQNLRIAA
ncbi:MULTISPECIES: energy transducer TonB [unclassified Pseudomonas]|uniref:energy transducer TonB n=1 Tax=unclassified Pseudomonas TaxID=196821 RepID=UPI000D38A733|nr:MULTISPECIES: energy transducer TonB [unclassified Pseudomonas]RAU49485.1 energy transducer TonB [Pseudomonas sp. RIT 409]RAU55776.1 energy transducer TonB [Pseudomonas sp. RIT 412]